MASLGLRVHLVLSNPSQRQWPFTKVLVRKSSIPNKKQQCKGQMPGAENVVGTVVLTRTFIRGCQITTGKPDGIVDPVTGIKTGQRQSVTSRPSGGGHGVLAFTSKPSKT